MQTSKAEGGKNILLCPFGSEGDVNPMLWAARALASCGHRPHFLVTANYGALAEAAGVPWTPVGMPSDFEEALRDKRFWHPFRGPFHVCRAMAETMPAFLEGFRALPTNVDLVIVSTFGLAASFAAEARGIPRAHIHMQPVIFRGSGEFPLLAHGMEWLANSPACIRTLALAVTDSLINAVLRKDINHFRKSLGLAPIQSVFHQAIMGGDARALLVPEWFAPPQDGWPSDLEQFGFPLQGGPIDSLPEPLEKFLGAGAAPVVWTHGSANYDTQEFWNCAVEAGRDLKIPCVLVGKSPPSRPLPSSCFHISQVPFESLFPRCAAVVHHAGIGTTAKAIAAGIPQLAIPRAHDQPDNAARIERLGLGLRLAYPALTQKRAIPLLSKILNEPLIAATCREFATRDGLVASPTEFCAWATSVKCNVL